MDYEKLHEVLPKVTLEWNVNDVSEWLQFIQLPHLVNCFRDQCVDGKNIKMINDRILSQIFGVHSKIQQKKIINWIHRGLIDFDTFTSNMKNLPQLNNKNYNLQQPILKKASTTNLRQKENIHPNSIDFLKSGAMIVQPFQGGSNLGMHVIHNTALTVGYGKNNNIQSLQVSIQDKHAIIGHLNNKYFVQDIGSKNGTYTKVLGRQPLKLGTLIELGSYQFEVFYINTKKKHMKIKVWSTTDKQFASVIVRIDFTKKTKYTFGRKKTNDFHVDDKHLSGIHCWIIWIDGQFMMQDFSSTNGTWVRLSHPGQKSEQHSINNGSIIKLGTTITYICRIHYQEQNSKMIDQGNLCYECNKNQRNCLMMPCQHNILCWKCSQNINQCPQCKMQVYQKIQLYN